MRPEQRQSRVAWPRPSPAGTVHENPESEQPESIGLREITHEHKPLPLEPANADGPYLVGSGLAWSSLRTAGGHQTTVLPSCCRVLSRFVISDQQPCHPMRSQADPYRQTRRTAAPTAIVQETISLHPASTPVSVQTDN